MAATGCSEENTIKFDGMSSGSTLLLCGADEYEEFDALVSPSDETVVESLEEWSVFG